MKDISVCLGQVYTKQLDTKMGNLPFSHSQFKEGRQREIPEPLAEKLTFQIEVDA